TDVARLIPIPGFQLILFGVEIFFLTRQRAAFTKLEATIDAIVSSEHCSEHQPHLKARSAAGLQIDRVDVGRVDEEIWAIEFARLCARELCEIVGQLRLGVAPREVGIGLREAELSQPLHHLRTRERLGEKYR